MSSRAERWALSIIHRRHAGAIGRLEHELATDTPELLLVDYFDTLVTRVVGRRDVRRLAADALIERHPIRGQSLESVLRLRRSCEKRVSEQSADLGRDREFALDAVARLMHHELGLMDRDADSFAEQVCDAELAVELLVQRPIVDLIEVIRAGMDPSRVVLVTDYHLPEVRVSEMMGHHGLTDVIGHVVVSCEHGASKATGRLHGIVLEEFRDHLNNGANGVLMIGDNVRSDGEMARRHGIRTIAMPRSLDDLGRRGAPWRYIRRTLLSG